MVEENPVEMPWNDVFVDFSRRKWREAEELGGDTTLFILNSIQNLLFAGIDSGASLE